MLPDISAAVHTERNNHVLVCDYNCQWSPPGVTLLLPHCCRTQKLDLALEGLQMSCRWSWIAEQKSLYNRVLSEAAAILSVIQWHRESLQLGMSFLQWMTRMSKYLVMLLMLYHFSWTWLGWTRRPQMYLPALFWLMPSWLLDCWLVFFSNQCARISLHTG